MTKKIENFSLSQIKQRNSFTDYSDPKKALFFFGTASELDLIIILEKIKGCYQRDHNFS